MSMFFRSNIFFELLIRAVFYALFVFFDSLDPFIRFIHPQELWKYQYPNSPSLVPSRYLWLIITMFPLTIFLLSEVLYQKKNEVKNACLALTLAYSLNGFLTALLKVIVGRPRPCFYYRCFPNGAGVDLTKCTGARAAYLDGRKSFPSGHSSFAFAAFVFMSLYLRRKMQQINYNNSRGAYWESLTLCVCLTPLLIAMVIAVSRTCDYHHHYEDVLAGSLLGSVISYVSYSIYFPKRREDSNLLLQDTN